MVTIWSHILHDPVPLFPDTAPPIDFSPLRVMLHNDYTTGKIYSTIGALSIGWKMVPFLDTVEWEYTGVSGVINTLHQRNTPIDRI